MAVLDLATIDSALGELATLLEGSNCASPSASVSEEDEEGEVTTKRKRKPSKQRKPRAGLAIAPIASAGPLRYAVQQMRSSIKRNWQRTKNWLKRARGSEGLGAPIGKAGSRIRLMPSRIIFGLPINPSLLKTKEGLRLAAALDRAWEARGKTGPDVKPGQPYTTVDPGRLNLFDEVEAIRKAFKIRPRMDEDLTTVAGNEKFANRVRPMVARVLRNEAMADVVTSVIGLGLTATGAWAAGVPAMLKSILITSLM